jgi:transposase
VDEKDKKIIEQQVQIERLERLLKKALERITELERRLGLNSTNSSKPPSSDGLKKQKRTSSSRKKGQRPSGGQKGHKGSTLEQVETPDQVIIHAASVCSACQASLEETPVSGVITRQVFDITEPKLEVTEHQSEVKVCQCGCQNKGVFPENVKAPVQYGDKIKVVCTYFRNYQMIPEDRLQEVLKDLFNVTIASATLVKFDEELSKKISPQQEQILADLKVARLKHLDETGIRINGKLQWLHVIGDETRTHYRTSPKRGNLLEGLRGIIVHDHWKPYFTLKRVTHALCNAHHLRELRALEEIEAEPWAYKMSMLLLSANSNEGHESRKIKKRYDEIVNEGIKFHEAQAPLGKRKNKRRKGHNLLLRFRKCKDAVLRFLTTPFVPFTNNQAEQDLRMMKVKQKISGCFRTEKGAEIFCIIRGFLSTARKQGKNLFEVLGLAFA